MKDIPQVGQKKEFSQQEIETAFGEIFVGRDIDKMLKEFDVEMRQKIVMHKKVLMKAIEIGLIRKSFFWDVESFVEMSEKGREICFELDQKFGPKIISEFISKPKMLVYFTEQSEYFEIVSILVKYVSAYSLKSILEDKRNLELMKSKGGTDWLTEQIKYVDQVQEKITNDYLTGINFVNFILLDEIDKKRILNLLDKYDPNKIIEFIDDPSLLRYFEDLEEGTNDQDKNYSEIAQYMIEFLDSNSTKLFLGDPEAMKLIIRSGGKEWLKKQEINIQKAYEHSLLKDYDRGESVRNFMMLDEDDKEVAYLLCEEFGADKIRSILSEEGIFSYFTDEKTSEISRILLANLSGWEFVNMMKHDLDYVIEQGGAPWLEQQILLVDQLSDIRGQEVPKGSDLILSCDKEKIDILEGVSSKYISDLLIDINIMEHEESAQQLMQRIKLFEEMFTPELVSSFDLDNFDLTRLLALRISFLEPLFRQCGEPGIKDLLSSNNTIKILKESAVHAHRFLEVDEDNLISFSDQGGEAVAWGDSMSSEDQQEIMDFLEMSGIDQILEKCVCELNIVARKERSEAAGAYSPNGNKMVIRMASGGGHVGVIIHEAGHAIETLLSHNQKIQALFDQYAIQVFFSGKKHKSSYVETFAMRGKKMSGVYLAESFADDFLFYILGDHFVDEERFEIFDQMIRQTLPDIDIEEFRSKMRKTIGNLYGLSPNQILHRKVHCDVAGFARLIDKFKKN